MYNDTKWICTDKELFCHMALLFVASVYVGISVISDEGLSAVQLNANLNMLEASITDLN